jgi:hypothetical protein
MIMIVMHAKNMQPGKETRYCATDSLCTRRRLRNDEPFETFLFMRQDALLYIKPSAEFCLAVLRVPDGFCVDPNPVVDPNPENFLIPLALEDVGYSELVLPVINVGAWEVRYPTIPWR